MEMKPEASESKIENILAMLARESLSFTLLVSKLSHYWKSMVPLPSLSRSDII